MGVSIEQLEAQNSDSLGITVSHAIPSLTNLSVIVRMTPADTPGENDYRFVRGASVSSTLPLPVSGSDLIFSPTRYSVEDGQRYGVEVRVVRTTDGIVSQSVYGDFRKLI